MDSRGGTEFGRALRQYRLAAGLSQEALAEMTGLSARGISDLERGTRRTPRPETVRLIMSALGLDHGVLAGLIAMSRATPAPQAAVPDHTSAPPTVARRFREGPIPRPSTQLIERSEEVAELIEILLDPGHSLVTLTGPGGAGKSHLASQVARDMLGHFPDGVACVFFGTDIKRDTPILPVVADALGVRDDAAHPLVDTIAEALGDARLLLLLDCLEHVVGDAQSVIDLLERCPELKVLTTSRIPLHVRGEYIFRVKPLSVPTPASELTAEGVERFSAIDLFLRRMRMASGALRLSSSNLAIIADICRRLDGIPLSIVLAAARTQEDFDRAATLYQERVTLKRKLNHPELTRTLGNLAQVIFHLGQTDDAVQLFNECIRIDIAGSDLVHLGVHHTDLALILLMTGDDDRASDLFRSALRTLGTIGHARMITCGLEGLATIATRKGEATRALTMFGAAEARRETIHYPLQPPDQWQYHESVALARSLVDCATFDAVWAAGRCLSMDATLSFALDEP